MSDSLVIQRPSLVERMFLAEAEEAQLFEIEDDVRNLAFINSF